MQKQIVKNVFSNYAATAMGLALGVFLIPFLISKLGKEAFGLIVLAESTIAFFEVATVSVRIALSRYAAFSLARGKDGAKDFSEYLGTGRGLLFFSSAIVLVVGLLVGWLFPHIFSVPERFHGQGRTLFLLIAAAFSVSIPNIVFWSVLYAKQRFDIINLSTSAGLILRALSLFFLFSLVPSSVSLTTYGFVYLMMTVLQNYIIYVWHRKVMPEASIRIRNFCFSKVKEILSFSVHTSVSRVSTLLSNNAMDILINIFWGPLFNAMYSVGFKFPSVMNRLFLDATWTLTPTFTELAAKEDRAKLKRFYFVYTKFVTIVVVPAALLLALMSDRVIHLWVGPGFETAAHILFVLILPLISSIPFAVSACVINAYGQVKWPSRVSLAASVFNVCLGIFLGKAMGMGLIGIAISTSVSSLVYYTFFMPWYACRIADVPILEYWGQAFLKPCLWSVSVVGAGLLILDGAGVSADSPLSFLGIFTSLALLCYAGAYFFVLEPYEKMKVRQALSEVFGDLKVIRGKRPLGRHAVCKKA